MPVLWHYICMCIVQRILVIVVLQTYISYSNFSNTFTRSNISFLLVSSISPAKMYSSKMAYTRLKLKTMSSSHTSLNKQTI